MNDQPNTETFDAASENAPQRPTDKVYRIALYRHLKYNFTTFYDYTDDKVVRDDYVRISEPVEVKFAPLADDVVIQNAVATFDAAERKCRLECEQQVAELRKQKANLLALTHQPEQES